MRGHVLKRWRNFMRKYKEEKNIDAMFDFEVKETELPIYVKWTRYCLHWYIRIKGV